MNKASDTARTLLLSTLVVTLGCAPDLATAPAAVAHVDVTLRETLQRGRPVTAIVETAGLDRAEREALLAELGLSSNRHFDRLGTMLVQLDDEDALDALAARPGTRGVYADIVMHKTAIADGLDVIWQPVALSRGYGGAGTTVAVLDTGVDYTRAAFGSCAAAGAAGVALVRALMDSPDPAGAVREVLDVSVERDRDGLVLLGIEADAFCHHMVRSVVGAAARVGAGREDPDWLGRRLAERGTEIS